MAFDMRRAHAAQETDGSWCGVEMSEFVLLHDLPVSGWRWVDGCRLEDDGGDTVEEWAVGDVGVASDPANVSHTAEDVAGVDIEDILDGQCSTEKVATGGVDDTLGLASGSRSL